MALGAVGCAKASDPNEPAGAGFGAGHGTSSGSSSQQNGNPQSSSSGGATSSGSGGSSGGSAINPDDASVSGDDATATDDGTTPTPADDSGTMPPFQFPPLSLPDSGGASTGDGGANACTTKICIDPVFDCPLQGCFNGCSNFFCM